MRLCWDLGLDSGGEKKNVYYLKVFAQKSTGNIFWKSVANIGWPNLIEVSITFVLNRVNQ